MSNTIQTIYSEFRVSYKGNSDSIIDFFANNTLFTNKIIAFNNEEEIRLFIEILCKYAEAIYLKNHYNQAKDLIEKYLPTIDSGIVRIGNNNIKDEWYRSLIFVKGMACYKLRDYKTSTLIFKSLINADKNNDNYENWFAYSRYGERIWLLNIISIASVILIVTNVFADKLINSSFTRLVISSVGFLGIICIWTYELYVKRSFRKFQSKTFQK